MLVSSRPCLLSAHCILAYDTCSVWRFSKWVVVLHVRYGKIVWLTPALHSAPYPATPWKRKWNPPATLEAGPQVQEKGNVLSILPGEFHRQRGLAGVGYKVLDIWRVLTLNNTIKPAHEAKRTSRHSKWMGMTGVVTSVLHVSAARHEGGQICRTS